MELLEWGDAKGRDYKEGKKTSEGMTERFIIFFSSFLSRPAPAAYGGSQARDQIRAIAAILYHSHNNTRSKQHVRSTPELTAMSGP